VGKEMISAADQDRGRTQSMARLLASAERELSSFVAAVNELFDAELARAGGRQLDGGVGTDGLAE